VKHNEKEKMMENILSIINSYGAYIFIGMGVVIVLLFILIMILFRSLNKVENRYRKLMRGANNKNIEELIMGYLDKVDKANEKSQEAFDLCYKVEEKMKKSIQKVSVIRYKAFEDVGSDLSFSVALLDENNDGVILTGIYGRNESTTYAKPIDKGISRYDLSEEEMSVLNKAIETV
jgi:Na+-transporting methylmalonyl-CoA/oxaloacetate decarboxylase gamma subunit